MAEPRAQNYSSNDALFASNESRVGLRANFFSMSIYFGIGHAVATTPLVYASSILDPQMAYLGNGTLYIVMLVSALVLAVPVVNAFGLKGGMTGGMALYTLYAVGFGIAALSDKGLFQGVFFVIASICGGLAAGLLWTAQGGYMAHTAAALAAEDQEPREAINSELTTQFAFYYLLFELIAKVLWSLLMMVGLSVQSTALLYALLALGSTYAMTLVIDLKPEAKPEEKAALSKLSGTVRLWSDVRIWLLSPTNITFGVASAFLNGYFNANVAKKVLGPTYIGYLSALTVIVSWAVTKLYGTLGQRYGNIVPISIGAFSFACIPFFLYISDPMGWGGWIVIFYVFQGSGRAVYESANKAIFADTFKGADVEGAFANCVLQMASASAICFFASAVVAGEQLQMAVLIFALITPIAFGAKMYLDKTASPEAGPLLEKSA